MDDGRIRTSGRSRRDMSEIRVRQESVKSNLRLHLHTSGTGYMKLELARVQVITKFEKFTICSLGRETYATLFFIHALKVYKKKLI